MDIILSKRIILQRPSSELIEKNKVSILHIRHNNCDMKMK